MQINARIFCFDCKTLKKFIPSTETYFKYSLYVYFNRYILITIILISFLLEIISNSSTYFKNGFLNDYYAYFNLYYRF